jgi:hypothetical protein
LEDVLSSQALIPASAESWRIIDASSVEEQMEKLSGLVLDVYDDSDGSVLRECFEDPDKLPEITKQAHVLTQAERSSLPDEAFALILVDGGVELKKFATIDPGNTALSVHYFLKSAHKLPVEAMHVAAENLWAACEQHGLETPKSLKKLALALREDPTDKVAMGAMGLLSGAMIVPAQVREARKNLTASSGTGGAVLTPDQVKQRRSMMGAM